MDFGADKPGGGREYRIESNRARRASERGQPVGKRLGRPAIRMSDNNFDDSGLNSSTHLNEAAEKPKADEEEDVFQKIASPKNAPPARRVRKSSVTAAQIKEDLDQNIVEVTREEEKSARRPARKRSLLAPFESLSNKIYGGGSKDEKGDPNAAGKANEAKKTDRADKMNELKSNALIRFVDGRYFQVLLALATIVALFGPDVWILALPPSADSSLEIVLFATLLLFVFELIVGIRFRTDYFNTFYFYLDLVAMVSLIPDIPFLFDPIIGLMDDSDEISSSAESENLAILRTGRLVRTGTRTTKVLRLLKFVRMVRILRMIKLVQMFRGHLVKGTYATEETDPATEAPNKLGIRLADLLGKRVIVGTIILLLTVPMLEVQSVDVSHETGFELLQTLYTTEKLSSLDVLNATAAAEHNKFVLDAAANAYLKQHSDIVFARLFNTTLVDRLSEDFRAAFIVKASVAPSASEHATELNDSLVLYDVTKQAEEQALLNIFLTLLMTFLLALSAYFFNRDVRENVVRPIMKTTKVMRKLAKTLFLLSNDNDGSAEGEDGEDSSLLEGKFIDSVVGQLITFFNVEDKTDRKGRKRKSLSTLR